MIQYKKTTAQILAVLALCAVKDVYADPLPDDSPLKTRNYLSNRPFTSIRGEALSGVLTGWADGADAFYDNPAGIGGLEPKLQPQGLSQLTMPYFGVAANDNATSLFPRLRQAHSARDAAMTDEALSGARDEVEYARASFIPNFVYKRLFVGLLLDSQIAMAPRDNNRVDIIQQTDQGALVGFSGEGAKGIVRLGFSAALVNRNIATGQIPYEELLKTDTRNAALEEGSLDYRGERYNLGLIITPTLKSLPLSFGVTAKDIGNSKLRPAHEGDDEIIIDQQIDTSAQLKFRFIDLIMLHWGVAANDISSKWTNYSEKFSTGLELNVGNRPGSLSGFGMQTSYSYRGLAYGAHLNLSVISLAYASYPVQVGTAEESLIERRHAGILSLNVAEK